MTSRAYQQEWKNGIYAAWHAGHQNVAGILPTGAGKSHTSGEIVEEFQGYVNVIAHRQELVSQLSMTMAKRDIPHQLVAPRDVIKFITGEQYNVLG